LSAPFLRIVQAERKTHTFIFDTDVGWEQVTDVRSCRLTEAVWSLDKQLENEAFVENRKGRSCNGKQ
jgi:hypothetical protein